MAIDQRALWANVFPHLPTPPSGFEDLGFIGRLRMGGRVLYEAVSDASWVVDEDEPDTVLAWRAFAVTAAARGLIEQLEVLRPFATHHHFAVREWAWLALRPAVIAEPCLAVATLQQDIARSPTYWRRFACEATRPRSVWGRTISELKMKPMLAEPLLAPLLVDDEPYVLTSVTNWLNDVSSGHLPWVTRMCEAHGGARASMLVRRATRSARHRRKANPGPRELTERAHQSPETGID